MCERAKRNRALHGGETRERERDTNAARLQLAPMGVSSRGSGGQLIATLKIGRGRLRDTLDLRTRDAHVWRYGYPRALPNGRSSARMQSDCDARRLGARQIKVARYRCSASFKHGNVISGSGLFRGSRVGRESNAPRRRVDAVLFPFHPREHRRELSVKRRRCASRRQEKRERVNK